MAISYILFSKRRKIFYIGSSREDSIHVRLTAHNKKSVRSTKSGAPWVVVETQYFDGYTDARKRELFLKSGVGRKEIYSKFGYLKDK